MTEIDNIRKLYTPPFNDERDKIVCTHNELCYAYHPICAIQVLLKRIEELERNANIQQELIDANYGYIEQLHAEKKKLLEAVQDLEELLHEHNPIVNGVLQDKNKELAKRIAELERKLADYESLSPYNDD